MDQQSNEGVTLRGMREAEQRYQALHEHSKRDSIDLADRLLDTIYIGLPLATRYEPSTAGRVIRAMIENAANSYRKAVDLALTGYYPLAWNVVRVSAEFWISAQYLTKKPGRAARWLDRKRNVPAFSTTLADLCDWADDAETPVEAEELRKVKELRYLLDEFAHATPTAWAYTPATSPDGAFDFSIGPVWQAPQFDLLLHTTMRIGSGLLKVIESNGGSADPTWLARAMEIEARVHALITAGPESSDQGSSRTP